MQLELFVTGVSKLDEILPGGLLKGGVYVLHGAPGTGKTILANHICFNHVKRKGAALYVSLLAESHTRMLQHLRALEFFDEAAMPRLYYVSATPTFAADGLPGVVELVRRELKRHQSGVLVIDGFSATRERAASQQEFLRFVQELQSHAAAADCVTLLLTSGTDPMKDAASTMVDGIIELNHELFERRTQRTLQVSKFRGGDFLPGTHSFQITNSGFRIYPRLEARFATPSARDRYELARCSSGVAGMDDMLGGGLPARTTNGLYGPTGSGKTTFGLQFVAPSSAMEPGVFFGFFESPERLRAKAEAMGIDLQALEDRGHLELIWRSQGEQDLDALGHDMLDAVRRRKAKRVFIDGYAGFAESAIQPERLTRYIASLAHELRALGATTLVTMESRNILGSSMELPNEGLASLLEGLIVLRYAEVEGRVRRLVSVTKIRDSAFDPLIRELHISARGLEVGGTLAPCVSG